MIPTATVPARGYSIPQQRPTHAALLFPHGLGDVVQALPSFRRYAARLGGSLSIGVLRRLDACREVLARQPYVRQVFGIADPWNDFAPRNHWDGYNRGMQVICGEYPTALPLRTRPPSCSTLRTMSKAVRIASELCMEYVPENPIPSPDVLGDSAERTRALLAIGQLRRDHPDCRIVAVHGSSGNRVKDVHFPRLVELAADLPKAKGDRRGTWVVPLPIRREGWGEGTHESVAFHWTFLNEADAFVGVDSGPAHLASTTKVPCTWVFTATPIEQAIPLWKREGSLAALVLGPYRARFLESWEAWKRMNGDLAPAGLEVTDGGDL